jgi:hypothetical protein
MGQLAANWDTFGWIKFRLGDSPAAEKYLKASWQLMQSAEIGEHLVEACERSGQKGKAAEVCHLANAALGHNASPDNNLREKLTAQMTRLRPFLKSASPVAKYSLSFPDDVPTRILLKANLNCSVYSKDCLLFISTVTEAATSSVPVQLNVAPQ